MTDTITRTNHGASISQRVSGMRLARRIQEGNESGYGAANSRLYSSRHLVERASFLFSFFFFSFFFFSFFMKTEGSGRRFRSMPRSEQARTTLFASPPRWLSVCTEPGIGATIKRVIYVRDGRSGGVGRPPRYLQVHTRSSRCAEISPINRSVIFGLLETSRQYADGCASYRCIPTICLLRQKSAEIIGLSALNDHTRYY